MIPNILGRELQAKRLLRSDAVIIWQNLGNISLESGSSRFGIPDANYFPVIEPWHTYENRQLASQ